ncbi:MAG: hypothetical protein Q8R81_12255 [Novosphingobium sp.]|uniref:hypothetical protein n=1 Tax=Novosphingobium sp. TaxID=1874826 RepID=UPI0027374F3B|nr:hypothetical protein [Novosphingobium sp.]MDP3551150.1 hypothetical protein [Novosphingobium sp.]
MKPAAKTLRAIEHLLFASLVAWLGIAGFLYERFHDRVPTWQLVPALIAFMAFGYFVYRVLLGALSSNRR